MHRIPIYIKTRSIHAGSFMMLCLIGILWLTGCAQHLPVPGGDSRINHEYYESEQDFLQRTDYLMTGMSQDKVFETLGLTLDDFDRMQRGEIVAALYGTDFVTFREGTEEHKNGSMFLQTLKGYKIRYKITEREHGFSSPIRIRTNEAGFEYVLSLVFKDEKLYADPILTGGVVHRSSSSTLFDGLNPGYIVDRVVNY